MPKPKYPNDDDLFGTSSYGSKPIRKCYNDHPPLKIGEFTIYGGSCCTPVVKDADVYIGFDYSMSFSTGHWPWAKKTEEVYYQIVDMTAPKDPASFKQMIAWTADQLKAGKKVHVGCIGGHGRTGTFLAALVTFMTGELDSITYVRKNYCTKAVETKGQMDFLNQHFGIKMLEPAKASFQSTSYKGSLSGGSGSHSSKAHKSPAKLGSTPFESKTKKSAGKVVPVSSRKNIFLQPNS